MGVELVQRQRQLQAGWWALRLLVLVVLQFELRAPLASDLQMAKELAEPKAAMSVAAAMELESVSPSGQQKLQPPEV